MRDKISGHGTLIITTHHYIGYSRAMRFLSLPERERKPETGGGFARNSLCGKIEKCE
jgi:hypothetical protein